MMIDFKIISRIVDNVQIFSIINSKVLELNYRYYY